MVDLTLKAIERRIFGRKVRQLRTTGKIPANVFGPKTKSKAITLDKKELLALFKKSGETSLVNLTIEGEKDKRPVLITNMHLNPATNELLHVDLHQVDLTTKTTANIPIETKGVAPAVEQGGILVALLKEVEVEALPADLPEKFELDLAILKEIGNSILVKDLILDSNKIEIKVDAEEPIITIQAAKEEEEPKPVVEEDAETTEEAEDKEEGQGEDAKESSPDDKSTKEESKDVAAKKPSSQEGKKDK